MSWSSSVTLQKPKRAAWITLSLAAIVGFFTLFAILTISPLLKIIISDLSLTFAEGGLLFSVLVAMIVIGALVGGYVGDKAGIRRAVGTGAIFVGIGAPLRGLATDYYSLLFFMALIGLGYGFLLPNLPKLAEAWFPPAYLGGVTGFYVASLFAGAAFGISITLPIYSLLGGSWRSALQLFGFFSAVAAIAWWIFAREPPSKNVVVGSKNDPRIDTNRVWTNVQTWLVAILLTLMNVLFYTLGGWLPTIFVERGSQPYDASLMASMAYFLAVPATLIIPFLSGRIGRRKPFLWILALVAAGASYGLLITPVFFGWFLASALGFATAGIIVLCYILPVELFPSSALGRASGIIVSVGFVGGIIGPLAAGLLRDATQSFASVILLLVLSALIAAVVASPIRETGRGRRNRVGSTRA
jgi:CP family cyanate transporter-like MFS transporter